VKLRGSSKAIECVSELVDREERLRRYDRKVEEYDTPGRIKVWP
jgi:hypothetical protein